MSLRDPGRSRLAFKPRGVVKLALIALLIVMFNTCPMWHACSPIAGMCSLDDLPAARGK